MQREINLQLFLGKAEICQHFFIKKLILSEMSGFQNGVSHFCTFYLKKYLLKTEKLNFNGV